MTQVKKAFTNKKGNEVVVVDGNAVVKHSDGSFSVWDADKTMVRGEGSFDEKPFLNFLENWKLGEPERAAKRLAESTEENRVATIKAQLLPVISCRYKMPTKEKNALKKRYKEMAEKFYRGTVTVTDSSRRTGGYYSYSDTIYEGHFFCNKWGGISKVDGSEIVSSRKKNYSTNYEEISVDDMIKEIILQTEEKITAETKVKNKIANAKLMVANIDVFGSEVLQILSK
jgi:hypothetical protein